RNPRTRAARRPLATRPARPPAPRTPSRARPPRRPRSASWETTTRQPAARGARLSPVAVRGFVCVEGGETRREEVVLLVRLAHVVQVVHVGWMGGGLDRREARVRNRRGRQP